MTSFEFREAMIGHLALRGNAYAEIQRNVYSGDVIALWPLRPDKMRVARVGTQLVYAYQLGDGTEKPFRSEQILHFRGLGTNGIIGYSPIEICREAIALGLATEEFGARWFGNGARPSVVLEYPGALSDAAYDRLMKSWEQRHAGLSNAQRVAILEEGMKVETIGVPPEDSQFLETRRFQVNEIARLFRIPPHMIGDLDKATFSNIEQQAIEFVTHTIRPWTERVEQRLEVSLIAPEEQDAYFIEHLIDGILRGDIVSRYQAYSVGRQWGWLSADDIRAMENMNPLPDGIGKIYLTPLNMAAAGEEPPKPSAQPAQPTQPTQATQPTPMEDEPLPDGEDQSSEGRFWMETTTAQAGAEERAIGARRRLARSFRGTFRHVGQRIVNREVNDIRNAARRFLGKDIPDTQGFALWLREFDQQHARFVRDYIGPMFSTYGRLVAMEVERELKRDISDDDTEKFIQDYTDGRANQWMAHLMGTMRVAGGVSEKRDVAVVEPPTYLADVEAELDKRTEEQADWFAEEESVRASNATALTLYALAGITIKRWMASGAENCDFCAKLNGRSIEIKLPFVDQNGGLSVAGMANWMPATDIGHPPLHRGCDCMVLAG